MVEWDAELVITGWNAAAAELFNFFEDEAIGSRIDHLLARRQIADLDIESWLSCDKTGVLREHIGIEGRKLCRWYNTPFMVKGERVGTLATIVDVTHQTALSNEELRSHLQSRTQVLKHTTARLQKAMSDRDQTIVALQKSESRFKDLAANVPGIIYQFHLSASGEPSFSFVSDSSHALFGISSAEIEANANALIDIIHSDDVDNFNCLIAHSVETLCDWQWQGRFVTPLGHTVWVQCISRPKRMPDGGTLWDGLMINISHTKQAEADLLRSEVELRSQTEQLQTTLHRLKRAQAKLIQSEKMSSLGQLVAGIAHEINNPVNFIHGNLSHVQSYVEDMMQIIRCYQAHHPVPIQAVKDLSEDLELEYITQDLPKLIASIKSGTDRIRQIVLSLRNFSRLDESEFKLADIHEGLESTLMILSRRLAATDSRQAIEVIKAYENIPMVECYVSQLNQVFMNILVNAIDAIDSVSMADQGYQIMLQTFQTADSVTVRITNNGPPILYDDRKRMFDPFFTTKPVGKGTGMGLAISYQTIVDLHKGTLECSQSEDQKTIFTIEIPIRIPNVAVARA